MRKYRNDLPLLRTTRERDLLLEPNRTLSHLIVPVEFRCNFPTEPGVYKTSFSVPAATRLQHVVANDSSNRAFVNSLTIFGDVNELGHPAPSGALLPGPLGQCLHLSFSSCGPRGSIKLWVQIHKPITPYRLVTFFRGGSEGWYASFVRDNDTWETSEFFTVALLGCQAAQT